MSGGELILLLLNADGAMAAAPQIRIIPDLNCVTIQIYVPSEARTLRVELRSPSGVMVNIDKAELSNAKLSINPHHAITTPEGILYVVSAPRMDISWDEEYQDNLYLQIRVENVDLSELVERLSKNLDALQDKCDVYELQLSSILKSNAWRVVRLYYSLKDAAKLFIRNPIGLVIQVLKGVYRLCPNPIKKKIKSSAQHNAFYLDLSEKYAIHNPIRHTQEKLSAASAYYAADKRKRFFISDIPIFANNPGTIAVHLHLFYTDLIPEFALWLDNIPYPYDLYVSVVDEDAKTLALQGFKALTNANQLICAVVPNRGRDVAPFLVTFNNKLLNYDYILHIHTKKSPHLSAGIDWRRYLLSHLLQSKEYVQKIFTLFNNNPELGLIYPEPHQNLPYHTLTTLSNEPQMQTLMKILKLSHIKIQKYIDFPVGTMFWAKKDAIKPLLRSELTACDFPLEEGQLDGTLAHAAERVFGIVCEAQGFLPAQIDLHNDLINIGIGIRNINRYLALDNADFARYLQRFSIISFAIFDTLVSSRFSWEAIWNIVEKRIQKPFTNARKQAQERFKNSFNIIDIHDIYLEYQRITHTHYEECEQYKEIEFETICELYEPRKDVVAVYHDLMTRKGVIITEDSPWSKAYIAKMLQKWNIALPDDFYLSSMLGDNKEIGSIYPFLRTKYRTMNLVHVGSHEIHDIVNANNERIHTFHIMNANDMLQVFDLRENDYEKVRDNPFCVTELLYERYKNH